MVLKEHFDQSGLLSDLQSLHPESASLNIARRTQRARVVVDSNYHSLSVVLDEHAIDTIENNNFARAIATMARGTITKARKEYPAFKESVWENSTTNPAILNTHISCEHDYHILETKRHWEKNSGSRAVFQSGSHSPTKKFPSINPLLGTERGVNSPNLEYGTVKMFGRTRVAQPFVRTKVKLPEDERHNLELLARHTFREELDFSRAPNPTTYHPYPDSWQNKPICGIFKESSMFKSQTLSRTLPTEHSLEIEKNIPVRSKSANSKIRPYGKGSGSQIFEENSTDVLNIVSMSMLLPAKSPRKDGTLLQENQKFHANPTNIPGNVLHEDGPEIFLNDQNDKNDRNPNKVSKRSLIFRLYGESFDDSDGESVKSFIAKQSRKAIDPKNKNYNDNRKEVRKDKKKRRPMSMSDNCDINNGNNFHSDNGRDNGRDISPNKFHDKIHDKNPQINSPYRSSSPENIKRNRDYLLSINGKERDPGFSIGKELRSSTWMCEPEKLKVRNENSIIMKTSPTTRKTLKIRDFTNEKAINVTAAAPRAIMNSLWFDLENSPIQLDPVERNNVKEREDESRGRGRDRNDRDGSFNLLSQSSFRSGCTDHPPISIISFHAPEPIDIHEKEEARRRSKSYSENEQFEHSLFHPSSSTLTYEGSVPTLTPSSSHILSKRSKNSPSNPHEWRPKSHQSKLSQQKRYENKEQIGILQQQTIDKFHSNMIHSSVAEIMPVSNILTKLSRDGSDNGRDDKIKSNIALIKDIKLKLKDEKKAMRNMIDNIRGTGERANEEIYKNRLLLPATHHHHGDFLGTHFIKKNAREIMMKNSPTIVMPNVMPEKSEKNENENEKNDQEWDDVLVMTSPLVDLGP